MDSNFAIECTVYDLLKQKKEALAWIKLSMYIDEMVLLRTDGGYKAVDSLLSRNSVKDLGKFICNALLFITEPYKHKLNNRERFKQRVEKMYGKNDEFKKQMVIHVSKRNKSIV